MTDISHCVSQTPTATNIVSPICLDESFICGSALKQYCRAKLNSSSFPFEEDHLYTLEGDDCAQDYNLPLKTMYLYLNTDQKGKLR